jgi:spermidine synthase
MFLANKILKTIESPINGGIEVVKSLAFGTSISIGGLTQSGGIVYEIWKKTLKRIKRKNVVIKKCLILGLGGGSVSKLVKKYWPNSYTTGVEIDKFMIKLGKEYLDLKDVEINVEDAYKFCMISLKSKKHYDLIIVDLYIGDKFPEKFENNEFIKITNKLLSEKGIVIFNRLYYDRKRKEALNFAKVLEENFENVEYFYPEANLMLICSK